MAYIHISESPGMRLDDYERVVANLDGLGEGHLVHIVGESGGTLHVVDVWQSKAQADRFASEQLFPAFERAGVQPGPDAAYTAMDGSVTINAGVEAQTMQDTDRLRVPGAIAGLLFAVAGVASGVMVPAPPAADATASTVRSYVTDHRHALDAWTVLVVVAPIVLLVFF